MNIDFNNQKIELQKDTLQLQQLINKNSDLKIENLLEFLGPSWYLPIINLAVENNNTEMIQNIINKSEDSEILNKEIKTKRDLNRKKLLKVFFKKKI